MVLRSGLKSPLTLVAGITVGLCSLADASGVRTSMSGQVVSVDPGAQVLELQTRLDRRAVTVDVEFPRANLIYYRWDGSLAEMRRGDAVEISGAERNSDDSITVGSIGVFKGAKTRGGEFARLGDDGRVSVRGELRRRSGEWIVLAEHYEFRLDLSDDIRILFHDDASLGEIARGQRISLTGNLDDGRVTRLSQLYINEISPHFTPNLPEASGGRRLFEGRLYRFDVELRLFVGSGSLDGEIVPFTVRWTENSTFEASVGERDGLRPGQIVLTSRESMANGSRALFILPGSEAVNALAGESGLYSEVVLGELVPHGDALGIRSYGSGQVHALPERIEVFNCRILTEDDLRVGRSFLTLGNIPDDGRWILDAPKVLIFFSERNAR